MTPTGKQKVPWQWWYYILWKLGKQKGRER